MAPEVAHGRYGREVDVYSLGIVALRVVDRPRALHRRVGRRNPDEAPLRAARSVADSPPLPPDARAVAREGSAAPNADGATALGGLQQGGRRFRSSAADSRGVVRAPRRWPIRRLIDRERGQERAHAATINFPHGTAAGTGSPGPGPKGTPPNLKDIFRGDVAKAIKVAEEAAALCGRNRRPSLPQVVQPP